MKKNLFVLGLALSIVLTSFHAHAAYDTKWYMGASYGNANVDTGIRGITATKSEDDKGYKLYAGYNFWALFGVEFYYADLGKESLKGNAGDLYSEDGYRYVFTVDNASTTWETESYGYDLVFYLPMAYFHHDEFVNRFKLFLKYGGHFTDTEITYRGNGIPTTHSYDDDYYPAAGIGLNVDLTEHIAVRAEYERSKIGNDKGNYVSAGVFVKF